MYFDEPVGAPSTGRSASSSQAVLVVSAVVHPVLLRRPRADLSTRADAAAAALFRGMTAAPRLPPFYRLVASTGSTAPTTRPSAWRGEGAAEGTLVWAREQSAGRGRRGRQLGLAAGQSLSARSCCARDRAAGERGAARLRRRAGARRRASPPLLPRRRRLRCKWPNDVLIDGAQGRRHPARIRGAPARAARLAGRSASASTSPRIPASTDYPATSLRRGRCAAVERRRRCSKRFAAAFRSAGIERWRRRGLRRRSAPPGSTRAPGSASAIRVRLERETLDGPLRRPRRGRRAAARDGDGARGASPPATSFPAAG